jgi:hypothetical protein
MVIPASDTTSARMRAIDCGGNAIGRSNVSSYIVIVTT